MLYVVRETEITYENSNVARKNVNESAYTDFEKAYRMFEKTCNFDRQYNASRVDETTNTKIISTVSLLLFAEYSDACETLIDTLTSRYCGHRYL